MGFLDSVTVPGSSAPPASGGKSSAPAAGGFLSSVQMPTSDQAAEAVKVQNIDQSGQVAKQQADYDNSIGGFFKNTLGAAIAPFKQGYDAAAANVQPKSFNPLTVSAQGTKAVEDSFMDSVNQAGSKIDDAVTAFKTPTSTSQKVGATGEAALGVVSPIFAALMAPLQYATAIPGIGQAADKVNEIFSAIGSGAGQHVATATVDDNPYLSPETKANIRPLVADTAGLVAQLIAGKAGADVVDKIASNGKTILNATTKDVTTQTAPKLAHSPDTTSNARFIQDTVDHHVQSSKMVLNNLPPEELEGLGGTSALLDRTRTNIADGLAGEGLNDAGTAVRGLTFDPNETLDTFSDKASMAAQHADTGTIAPTMAPAAASDAVAAPEGTPTPIVPEGSADGLPVRTEAVQKPVGNGDAIPHGLSKSVENEAIKAELTKSFGDLPTHNQMDMKVQADMAQNIMNTDMARAVRIAMGKELPPEGLLAESMYTAMRIRAREAGDAVMMHRLATESIVPEHATGLGQRIKALDSGLRDDEKDPVDLARDVKKAREAKVEKKTGKTVARNVKETVDDIKKDVKAARSPRPTWEDFVKELSCNA